MRAYRTSSAGHDGVAQRSAGGAPGKRTLVDQVYAGRPSGGMATDETNAEETAPTSERQTVAEPHTAPTAPSPGATGSAPPVAGRDAPDPTGPLIPFDRNPLSAPGEQIIFDADLTHATPTDYQLVYTGAGGDFNTTGSGTKSVTVPGLKKSNLYFFIDSKWDKKSSVTVKLEIQKAADKSVVKTETWTFGPKPYFPTEVTQKQSETDEHDNPARFRYKVGPDRGKDGKADYEHQTVLESFGTRTSNIKLADLKPEYAKAKGLTTDQQVTDHFFGTSSENGTFAINKDDEFGDRHSGGVDKARLEAALTTMKDVYVDLPQTYSSEPGVALGKYTVRRITKENGDKKIKKWKTP
jgi:hypothetical protein